MKKRLVKALALGLSVSMLVPAGGVFADQEASESSKVSAEVNSKYSISIPKSIVLDVDEKTQVGTAAYKVGVLGDINYNTSVYVVPQPQFNLVKGDSIVNTTVTQDKTEWAWSELSDTYSYGNGSLLANDLSAGSWEGVFYFNVDLTASGSEVSAPADKNIVGEFQGSETPVNAGTYQMGQGQSASIAMVYNGKNVTSQTTYISDNERITVDENGNVDTTSAIGGDEATITATYTETTVVAGLRSGLFNPMAAATGAGTESKTLTAQFKIQVIGIAFDKDTVEVTQGDSITVEASILPGSVTGTVKWTLNGLDFGAEGNQITINVSETATPGNYTLVASYGGTTETLNIKVKEPVSTPEISGVVDGGEYEGSAVITVGKGNTVTVNGNSITLDSDNSFTLGIEGVYNVVVIGTDGNSQAITITITHIHTYVDGFCSICNKVDASKFSEPGLYSASGKKLLTWDELSLDYEFDPSKDYTKDTAPLKDVTTNTGVNPNNVKCILVLPNSVNRIGAYALYDATNIKAIVASSIIEYGEYSLANTAISTVDLSGVSIIPDGLLYGCSNITMVSLDGISKVGQYAFSGTSISELRIPSTVSDVGYYVIKNCNELKTVIIEDSDKELCINSFMDSCDSNSINFISYRQLLWKVNSDSFKGCNAVYCKSLKISYSNKVSIEGTSNTSLKCLLIDNIISTNSQLVEITKFNDYKGLKIMSVPDGVGTIDNNAFSSNQISGATSLSKVYIPSSCTTIWGTKPEYAPFNYHQYLTIYCKHAYAPDTFKQYWNLTVDWTNKDDTYATVFWNQDRLSFNQSCNDTYFNGNLILE